VDVSEEVLETVREKDPVGYAKIVASLLPKQIEGADGGPLLNSIVVTYRKPGDPAPEPEVVRAAVVALDAATSEPDEAEAA
jgi:hypothetical protein